MLWNKELIRFLVVSRASQRIFDFFKVINMEMPRRLEEYFELARQLYQTGPSHDFSHIERVFRLSLTIGRSENADLEIIGIAALFHDIAREEENTSGGLICHAAASAERTRKLLIERMLERGKIEAICACIATHRFRDHNDPQTLEAKCLFDADKLDSLGAVGIARAYLWLGERGGTVYVAQEIWEQTDFESNRPEEDSLQREWHIKLRNVKDCLYTQTARQIAAKRHQTMKNFLSVLESEVLGEE